MRLRIPPLVMMLAFGLLGWALSRYVSAADFPASHISKLAAYICFAAGGALLAHAVSSFIRAKTTVNPVTPEAAERLVTDGLYRYTRNPMYLGMLILLIGWTLWLGNPASLLLLPVFVIYLTVFQIKPEEAALSEKFGSDYDAYRRRVRRWL